MDLRPGTRVDRYTLVEPIGEGGQGCVWKVIDPERATVRALKLLDTERLPASAARRAKLEVQAVMRSADHPAVVPCFDVVILPDRRVGLVFELVRGQALSEVLDDPRMTPSHRRAVLVRLASALAHVHGRGVVHRDLKPDNVLVTDRFWREPFADDAVRLVDFGIAAVLTHATGLTSVGSFVGTVPYVPPEVLLQRPGSGPARDVFAFGVLGWELLFGGHPSGLPHDASVSAFASAYRAASTGIEPFPRRPGEGPLAPFLRACLALEPAARLADGAAVQQALQAALGEDGARSSSRTKPHAAPRDTEPGTTSQPVVRTVPSDAVPEALSRPAPGPTAQMTASLESERSNSRTPLPPSRPAPAAEAPRERGLWAILLALFVALAGVVYIVARGSPSDVETIPLVILPPSASPAPSRTETPRPPDTPPAPMPCCPDGSCNSLRRCDPSARCNGSYLPERAWLFRLSGAVAANGKDLTKSHPGARICLRVEGGSAEPVCTSAQALLSPDTKATPRLPLRTADLVNGRVFVRVLDGDAVIASGRSVADIYKTSALCQGIKLRFDGGAPEERFILGFLDDPD